MFILEESILLKKIRLLHGLGSFLMKQHEGRSALRPGWLGPCPGHHTVKSPCSGLPLVMHHLQLQSRSAQGQGACLPKPALNMLILGALKYSCPNTQGLPCPPHSGPHPQCAYDKAWGSQFAGRWQSSEVQAGVAPCILDGIRMIREGKRYGPVPPFAPLPESCRCK